MDAVPPMPLNGTMPTGIEGVLGVMGDYLTATIKDGTRELTSLLLSQFDPATIPCNGDVMVLAKSSIAEINEACPSQWIGMSCTCVRQTSAPTTNEWIYRVKSIPMVPTAEIIPVAVDATVSVLNVNTIGQFILPPSITTFRLLGVTDTKALTFNFDSKSPFGTDNSYALVASASKNNVHEVEIANIDFSSVEITDVFLPPSVADVTFRNCALKSLPSPILFLRWTNLTTYDLSGNQLSTWYSGYGNDQTIKNPATITSLNLARNAFTSIPFSLVTMDALQSLNFSHNPVTNFTISDTLFDRLSHLQMLDVDGINSSMITPESCTNKQTWKTVHGINFCVVSSLTGSSSSATGSAAGAASMTNNFSSHTNSLLVYVTVGGGIVIAALVLAIFLVRRKRHRDNRPKAFSRTGDDHDSPLQDVSFNAIHSRSGGRSNHSSFHASDQPVEVNAALLNDPMIITSRLDHREVRIGELLKQGGFGVVFSGVYRRRRVAIKTLRRENAGNRKNLEAFLREIALMATLEHPRVVEYIGCAWDSIQNLAVIVELMDRGDLREVLQNFSNRNAPLTWASHKTRFALHIAEGLQYLHTLSPKVIHRDLKSKNVLVNTNLDAKLTDFGISREGRFEQTHMTAGIGTSFWIAPEVLAGLKYDERADIYSFGVVLSEIDTDDYPYWNDTQVEGDSEDTQRVDRILGLVLAGKMRPRLTPECPELIRILADRCLTTEPSQRPTATEIVHYLARVVEAPLDLRRKYLELTIQ